MDAGQLENLIKSMQSGSEEANQELYSIIHDIESIFLFLECLQSTGDNYVKSVCLYSIKNMVILYRDDLSIESQQTLFNAITSLIPEEANDSTRDIMGEFITYLKIDPDFSSSIQATQFSASLIESKQDPLISTAFYIIYHSFNHLPEDHQQMIFHLIYPIAVEHLMNPYFNCRYNSLTLLDFLISKDDNFDIINSEEFLPINQQLTAAILQNASRCNTETVSSNEINRIYSLANSAIKCVQCFGDCIEQFAEIFLELLFKTEIDPMVRYGAEQNIENLFTTAIDQIESLQQKIIEGCVQLSIEYVSNYPDAVHINCELIDWLQVTLSQEETYHIFYGIAVTLIESNDITQVRIAFDIFESIISLPKDCILDDMDNIIDFIFTFLDPDNNTNEDGDLFEFIPKACANVIISLCKYFRDEISVHTESLIQLLFNYIHILRCLRAIIELTTTIELSPENCQEYIQQTCKCIESVLSDADSSSIIIFDSLVELLTSFLEMINRQDESQYSNIAPFVQLLTDNSEFSPSQKMLGVNLFGKLVIICPQSASGDIDNFIKFSLELFSEDDSETNKMIVEFLNTIASNQSKCLEPYVADIIESLINQIDVSEEQLKALLLNQENEEEEEEDQNEDVEYVSPTKSIYDMQGCILALLSTICSIYPTQTCNYFEKVHSLLETYINSRDPDLAISAIEDFGYLSEAYVTIGSDVDGLLKTLIEQLSDPDMLYVDIVAELWKGISVVLANAGSQLIKQRSAEIVNILDSVLFKRKNYYNEKGDVEEIGLIFRHPVFMVLDIFIEELGIESLQYIEQFIEVLDTMANNRQKNTHCFAARSLAKIGSILPPDDENGDRFINLALQIGLDDIKQKTVTMQICGFSTIYIVLNHRPDLIDPIKGDLLDFTASIMKRCSAGAAENIDVLSECSILFLSIVRVFNLVDDSIIDMISEATQYAKLDIDSPNLIPFALFASFIIQYGQEEYMDFYLYVVLLILSSSQMILRKIEPDTLIEFAKAISSLPEEEIVGKLQWNLTKFEILQRNVANILGEGQES